MKTVKHPASTLLSALLSLFLLSGCAQETVGARGIPLWDAKEFRHDDPTFAFHYPVSWRPKKLEPDQYAHVAAGKGAPNIIVSRGTLPQGSTTASVARVHFTELQASQGFKSGEIAYAKRVRLADGTPAYENLITWKHPSFGVDLATLFLIPDKEGAVLQLVATDLGKDLTRAHREACYSLTLM